MESVRIQERVGIQRDGKVDVIYKALDGGRRGDVHYSKLDG